MTIRVCDACGNPECWAGEYMCDGAMDAGMITCPCDWGDDGRGWEPLAIRPDCLAHGEPS